MCIFNASFFFVLFFGGSFGEVHVILKSVFMFDLIYILATWHPNVFGIWVVAKFHERQYGRIPVGPRSSIAARELAFVLIFLVKQMDAVYQCGQEQAMHLEESVYTARECCAICIILIIHRYANVCNHNSD